MKMQANSSTYVRNAESTGNGKRVCWKPHVMRVQVECAGNENNRYASQS